MPEISISLQNALDLCKHILERLNLKNKIELIIDDETNQIHIRSLNTPRKNWEEAFQKMHENGEDELLIDDGFDLEAWDW